MKASPRRADGRLAAWCIAEACGMAYGPGLMVLCCFSIAYACGRKIKKVSE